jgi:arsenate reductase
MLVILLVVAFALFVWWLWREPPAGSLVSTAMPRPSGDDVQRPRHVNDRERVLFVCTRNSARSQMAEALLRAMASDHFDTASAGTDLGRVHPLTVRVMAEIGIDVASHRAKRLGDVGTRWDYVITMCDAAYEQCPDFPAKTSRLHWSVLDPAATTGTEGERLAAFRRVRDDIQDRI